MAAMVMLMSGCGRSWVKAHPDSEKLTGSYLDISLTHHRSDPPPWTGADDAAVESTALIAALAPLVIEQTLKFVKAEVEREAARYTAAYNGAVVDDFFYQDRTRDAAINLKTIRIARHYRDDDDKDALAMALDYDVAGAADGSHFRLAPAAFTLKKGAAKTRKNDDTIDLEIRVFLDFFFVEITDGEDGAVTTSRVETVAAPPITLNDISFGHEWTKGEAGPLRAAGTHWLPVPRRTKRSATVEDQNGNKSLTDEYGLGVYVVRVEVAESDELGAQLTKFAGYVGDENVRNAILEQLLKLIGDSDGDAGDLQGIIDALNDLLKDG